MELKLIRGMGGAHDLLTRLDPLDFTGLPETVLSRTREIFGESVTPEASVIKMLHDVRDKGDEAVRRYAKLLDGVELDDLRVSPQQMEQARASISEELRHSLELAAQRVREFHEAVIPKDWIDATQGLGELVRPLDRVGLYAPGGTASYPSTVLMTAIPPGSREWAK